MLPSLNKVLLTYLQSGHKPTHLVHDKVELVMCCWDQIIYLYPVFKIAMSCYIKWVILPMVTVQNMLNTEVSSEGSSTWRVAQPLAIFLMCGLLYSEALPANPPWQNSCLHKSIFGDGGNYSVQRKP